MCDASFRFVAAVTCKYPPRVPNAKYTASEFTYGSEAIYECSDGYWIEEGIRNVTGFQCTLEGNWEPDPLETVNCVGMMTVGIFEYKLYYMKLKMFLIKLP